MIIRVNRAKLSSRCCRFESDGPFCGNDEPIIHQAVAYRLGGCSWQRRDIFR